MLVLNNLKSSEDWASHIVTGEQKLFLGVAPSHWADSHTRLGKVAMYSMWTGMEFGSNFLSHPSCSVLSLWKKSNNWQNAKAKLDCWLSATLNPFPPQCCFDWGMFVWHCPSAMTLIQINFHTGSCGGSFFFFFLAAFPLVQDQGHTLICFHGEWYFLWLIKLPPFNSPRQTAQLLSADGHDRA